MPGRIEDCAIIGNCESAALVGRDGSIDWLALPRFDSAACLAALLGDVENGRWKIAPKRNAEITRRYRDGTLILVVRTRQGVPIFFSVAPRKSGAQSHKRGDWLPWVPAFRRHDENRAGYHPSESDH